MSTHFQSRSRRLTTLVAASALAALVLGSGTVSAAPSTKVSVCHFDRTLGAYLLLNVSTKSAHLPKGDYLADSTLIGRTVYSLAFTDSDGVDGYSGCDNLIAALVENSGDSTASAGDQVIFGKFPTAIASPFAFATFGLSPVTVAAVNQCGSAEVSVDLGSGNTALWQQNGNETFGYGNESFVPVVYLYDAINGGGAALNFSDHMIIDYGSTQLNESGPLGDEPFVDLALSAVCPA